MVVLSNAGVNVTRHYLDATHLHPFNPFNPINASQVFWQAGMGTAFGPFMIGSSSFYQCVVNDTMRYDLSNSGLPGPGGPGQICWQLNMGTPEVSTQNAVRMRISPNPAEDNLVIELTGNNSHLDGRFALVDARGRGVLSTNLRGSSTVVDVSSLTGLFTVILDTGEKRLVERVVVE